MQPSLTRFGFHPLFLQLENVKNGFRNSMWDSLVFSKTAQRLGGRVRIMATGAAPMPAHVMDFLKVRLRGRERRGERMKALEPKTRGRNDGSVPWLRRRDSADVPFSPSPFLPAQVAFCCDVMQGYGMTENAAAACVTPAQYHTPGTVGEPLPCCEVKLADVPEMNYTHNGRRAGPAARVCHCGRGTR